MNESNPNQRKKIINFSGAFYRKDLGQIEEFSWLINCAIQGLARNAVYFVDAAGNEGVDNDRKK